MFKSETNGTLKSQSTLHFPIRGKSRTWGQEPTNEFKFVLVSHCHLLGEQSGVLKRFKSVW